MDFKKLTKIVDSTYAESSHQKYNYPEAIKSDVIEYIKEHYNNDLSQFTSQEAAYEALLDEICKDGQVIGGVLNSNSYGSYWPSDFEAEEALCHNLDLLFEVMDNYPDQSAGYLVLKDGANTCDHAIRCYLLSDILDEVLSNFSFSAEGEENVEA